LSTPPTLEMTTSGFGATERERFLAEGFVVMRRLADSVTCQRVLARAQAELAAEQAPVEYEAQLHYPGAPASLEAPGGHTVRRLLQACARDAVFRDWATSPVVAAHLRQLLGPRVGLAQAHHNCVMTKQPRYSSATGWHQDVRYWSFERPELVSVWLALGEERPANGGLHVIPGSHRMELERDRFDAALFLREDLAANRPLLDRCTPVELTAGDVLFFHCRTLHAASANATDAIKFSLVFTYHALDNLPQPGTRSASLPSIPL
jgi:phytanoyl-CoA hydroxylase